MHDPSLEPGLNTGKSKAYGTLGDNNWNNLDKNCTLEAMKSNGIRHDAPVFHLNFAANLENRNSDILAQDPHAVG